MSDNIANTSTSTSTPIASLLTVEEINRWNQDGVKEFLQERRAELDLDLESEDINKIYNQKVLKGSFFLKLTQKDLLSINIPLGTAKEILKLISKIKREQSSATGLLTERELFRLNLLLLKAYKMTTKSTYELASQKLPEIPLLQWKTFLNEALIASNYSNELGGTEITEDRQVKFTDDIKNLNELYNAADVIDGTNDYSIHEKIKRIIRQAFGYIFLKRDDSPNTNKLYISSMIPINQQHTEYQPLFLECIHYFEDISSNASKFDSSLSSPKSNHNDDNDNHPDSDHSNNSDQSE
ncbi:hypothetical protein RhiirA1_476065 [Rhizophagus irregularis]|uniref:Uncharacterized protein n=2 Tax=Rhizophagus irregularis TaxID=588596 RepID=A0A2I1FIZ8_9GLOM|nr:hypothetical protein RhiirA1_476065 [Rhizophagus irregularis]PKY34351.1 hypothetical protein RhiirB3_453979 [Rhizophagus irregularis]